jgi:hypothetical protein
MEEASPMIERAHVQRYSFASVAPELSGTFLLTGPEADRPHCMADDPVHREPVSGAKFPAIREENRDFSGFG